MTAQQPKPTLGGARLLPWLPLVVATLNSYGPVSNNYGFALLPHV